MRLEIRVLGCFSNGIGRPPVKMVLLPEGDGLVA